MKRFGFIYDMIPLSAASTERFHTVVLDVVVEMGVCRLLVRAEEEKTYTEREDAEDSPTDETEVEQEEFHLVAAHHTHAFLYGCIVASGSSLKMNSVML